MKPESLFLLWFLIGIPLTGLGLFLVGRYGELDKDTEGDVLLVCLFWPVTVFFICVLLVCGILIAVFLGVPTVVVYGLQWCGEKGKELKQRKAQ